MFAVQNCSWQDNMNVDSPSGAFLSLTGEFHEERIRILFLLLILPLKINILAMNKIFLQL